MRLSIRPARDRDAVAIAALLSELGYPASPERIRRRLRERRDQAGSAAFVADIGREAAGFLSAEVLYYFPEGARLCRITALVVASAQRRKGVGRALVDAATSFARESRCDGLEITTAERRIEAQQFYERLGFSRTSYRFYHEL